MINWRYVGGATGLQLLRPEVMAPFENYIRMLFVVMAWMGIAGVAIARYVQDSWIGRGLRALRDSEEAAESCGVPTLKLKLFACTVSGALMGVAGAPLPMYLSLHRAGLDLQPQLHRRRAGRRHHRRHVALARAGHRRAAARLGAADRHRHHLGER